MGITRLVLVRWPSARLTRCVAPASRLLPLRKLIAISAVAHRLSRRFPSHPASRAHYMDAIRRNCPQPPEGRRQSQAFANQSTHRGQSTWPSHGRQSRAQSARRPCSRGLQSMYFLPCRHDRPYRHDRREGLRDGLRGRISPQPPGGRSQASPTAGDHPLLNQSRTTRSTVSVTGRKLLECRGSVLCLAARGSPDWYACGSRDRRSSGRQAAGSDNRGAPLADGPSDRAGGEPDRDLLVPDPPPSSRRERAGAPRAAPQPPGPSA